ncbi:MAG: branched-chain amino acid ABC transporter permease [Deltaproteobacteria bacterium HGW-Deltaproteobacteria-12]|jgi:branched-chain amino acid transport system permease protein|nr:MAG: branched-chain amino acid ABC transporter permease [Deltaproteobacteria bacterium HGW-Deltaproteobacteria-12]
MGGDYLFCSNYWRHHVQITSKAGKMKYWKYLGVLVLLVIAIILPRYLGLYQLQIMNFVFVYIAFALSWDMLLRSGQLSFGIAGFAGIGGYTSIVLCYYFKLEPLLCIVAGAGAAAIVAMLVGSQVLKLRGLYFSIVTLAIGEIFRIVVRNLEVTGEAEGLLLPNAIFMGDPTKTYWMMFTVAAITIILSILFQKTRMHYALTSIANDEIVAASSGVNIFKYLVIIFAVTSAIQGMAGAAYWQIYASATPEGAFNLGFALIPITMALFGGIGTTWGPVIGATILSVTAELLKLQFPHGHLLVYGLIMVIAILWFPNGIMGIIKKFTAKFNN